MFTLDLKSLSQWINWPQMVPLVFDVEGDYRNCRVRVVSDAPIRLYAVTQDDYQPLCIVNGAAEIGFTADEGTALAWYGEERPDMNGKTLGAPLVRVLSLARSQMMEGDDHDSFTVVEPRGSGENAEMRRMQHLMMININRRLAAQEAEWQERLAAQMESAGVDVQMPPEGGEDAAASLVE